MEFRCFVKNKQLIGVSQKNIDDFYPFLLDKHRDFKIYIESLWEDWMNWENYGLYNGKENYGWDFDHIVPLSSAKCEEVIDFLRGES